MENRDYFTKQLMIWIDYYQQQQGNEDSSISIAILQQVDRETIATINDYLQTNNRSIGAFILTFINGLILCQLYSPLPCLDSLNRRETRRARIALPFNLFPFQ
jgi:hypothetical protein